MLLVFQEFSEEAPLPAQLIVIVHRVIKNIWRQRKTGKDRIEV